MPGHTGKKARSFESLWMVLDVLDVLVGLCEQSIIRAICWLVPSETETIPIGPRIFLGRNYSENNGRKRKSEEPYI